MGFDVDGGASGMYLVVLSFIAVSSCGPSLFIKSVMNIIYIYI